MTGMGVYVPMHVHEWYIMINGTICPGTPLLNSNSNWVRSKLLKITWPLVQPKFARRFMHRRCPALPLLISLHSVFFLTLIYIELTLKVIYLCTRTYILCTFSQLLMTHLGFFMSIHTPTIQPFQKEHQKKTMRCFFGLAQACCGALGICRRNSDGSLAEKHCLDAGMAFVDVCGEVLEVTFSMTSISNCKIVGCSTFERFVISSWHYRP